MTFEREHADKAHQSGRLLENSYVHGANSTFREHISCQGSVCNHVEDEIRDGYCMTAGKDASEAHQGG